MITFDNVRGKMIEGEPHFLAGIAATLKPGSIVYEIGAFEGLSAISMIRGNPHIKIHSIDRWDDIENMLAFRRNCNEYMREKKIVPVQMDSKNAHVYYDNESADLVFIDGDHSEDGAYADMINWYPKKKKDGIMLIHDCVGVAEHPEFGVYLAFQRFIEEKKIKYFAVDNKFSHSMVVIHD